MTDAPARSDGWPDETDTAILAALADLHDMLDPPPDGLADQAIFAMAVAGLDAEIARVQDEQLAGSGARGTERTRTVSFDADSLTIMVTVTDMPDGEVRVDGWLAPAQALQVELRLRAKTTESSHTVRADDGGRFVFPMIGHGLAQFIVQRDADAGHLAGDAPTTVVTPAITL